MSDEEDYMSSAFLAQAEQIDKKQKSSLVPKNKKPKPVQKIEPLKVREKRAREEGLSKEIDENNKGRINPHSDFTHSLPQVSKCWQ